MNKLEFTLRLARESNRPPGEAADDLDTLVHRILRDLRRTKNQSLPPKGTLPKVPAARQAKRQGDSKQSRP
jgi:hypothetical protein